MTEGARPIPRLFFGARYEIETGERVLPEERAVALSFNGTTQAVMMATPADLEDFAYGFALTEGIATPAEIEEIAVVRGERGVDVQTWLADTAEARLKDRRRTMAGPVGCGLCGIDSIDQALRELPPVPPSAFRMTPAQVKEAIAALPAHQPLHDLTRAAHCAGFWTPAGLFAAREDVGRHNALDKLAGHLVRHPHPEGAVVLTSRVSIDMVQKVAAIGAPVLIAVSAPTADAVALAERLGITLIALARPERFELFTHSDRLVTEESHVR
ncbi:formate dehydrogenase accessory sulfurtransferase FdhD [Pseudogemmobacter humi]|uniref:Sulfur carrier protein FdhD n=1 Tax=Pseudogemmobacter humi TaxID=2483812 RepID=A0A3P5X909_9RHOB|nr:formate dehydrogenase accessory sulfurtransferase FdhD [Pseudogemmobacter humi]VDC27719.1 formate dehydrogenase accessory protein [Pseudogemmobacter humi]